MMAKVPCCGISHRLPELLLKRESCENWVLGLSPPVLADLWVMPQEMRLNQTQASSQLSGMPQCFSWDANKDVLYSINPYPNKQNLGSLSILRPVFPPCSATALMHWPGECSFLLCKMKYRHPWEHSDELERSWVCFLAGASEGFSEARGDTFAAGHHCPGMFL